MCSCIYSKNRVTHQRGCSDWLHVRLYEAAKSFASAAPRLWWQGIRSPPDLKHSPRVNTGLWRLTPGLLYSLNAEIYMTPVKVAALPASASIHPLLLFLLPLAALALCSCMQPPQPISGRLSPPPSPYTPLQRQAGALWPLLVCVNCMGLITKTLLAGWKEVKLNPSSLKQTSSI